MISERVGTFVSDLRYQDIPPASIEKTKQCIIDWFGCAIAGVGGKPCKIIEGYFTGLGGLQEASVVGSSSKIPALHAAFVNAAFSHYVEMDDGHRTSLVHPGSSVIPTALALCEARNKTGKDLITAVVAGYEVGIRVGEAMGPDHYRLWHSSATCGTFGAAAAASKVIGLDASRTADALGNAGTQAAGLWQFLNEGSLWTKLLHLAKANYNGMLSALLAEQEFTGNCRIFEGDQGFCRAMSARPCLEALTIDLGKTYKVNEVNFKVHPSCGHTHAAIDAALKLRHRVRLSLDHIEKVIVNTYSTAARLTSNWDPQTAEEAKFSIPYCVSLALAHGVVKSNMFAEPYEPDVAASELMKRVEIRIVPEFDQLFPHMRPCDLRIETLKGEVFEESIRYRKGDPEDPLTDEEVAHKFSELTAPRINKTRQQNLLSLLFNLEFVDNLDEIMKLIHEEE